MPEVLPRIQLCSAAHWSHSCCVSCLRHGVLQTRLPQKRFGLSREQEQRVQCEHRHILADDASVEKQSPLGKDGLVPRSKEDLSSGGSQHENPRTTQLGRKLHQETEKAWAPDATLKPVCTCNGGWRLKPSAKQGGCPGHERASAVPGRLLALVLSLLPCSRGSAATDRKRQRAQTELV